MNNHVVDEVTIKTMVSSIAYAKYLSTETSQSGHRYHRSTANQVTNTTANQVADTTAKHLDNWLCSSNSVLLSDNMLNSL